MSTPLSFDDLATAITTKQAREKIYQILARLGLTATSWKPGAWMRTLVAANAIIVASFSGLVSSILKSGFWQLADGDWLTLAAKYLCNVIRREATFASGDVTLTNTGTNVYNDVAIGDLTVQNTITKKTFKNTAIFSLGAASTVVVAVSAEEIGSASTSHAHSITTVVTPMPGVTCDNAAAVVGYDEEGDASVKHRCDRAAAAASPNGARAAYSKFAMFTLDDEPLRKPDGTLVDVNRVHVSHASMTNAVTVRVAGANDGVVTGTIDDPSTDLGTVHQNIQQNAVPHGVTETTTTVTTLPVDVNWLLVVDDTSIRTDDELDELVADALVLFFSLQPIGGYQLGANRCIFRSAISAAIKAVDPLILDVALVSPAGDVYLADDQVAVVGTLTQGDVTRIQVT